MYIYMCMYVCICIYIYIYIHTHTQRGAHVRFGVRSFGVCYLVFRAGGLGSKGLAISNLRFRQMGFGHEWMQGLGLEMHCHITLDTPVLSAARGRVVPVISMRKVPTSSLVLLRLYARTDCTDLRTTSYLRVWSDKKASLADTCGLQVQRSTAPPPHPTSASSAFLCERTLNQCLSTFKPKPCPFVCET